MIRRADLDQIGRLANQLRLVHIRGNGEVHLGIFEEAILENRGRIDRRADQLQRQRDEITRHHGFEKIEQLFVQRPQAFAQILVIVSGQIFRLNFQRKGGQRRSQRDHGGE